MQHCPSAMQEHARTTHILSDSPARHLYPTTLPVIFCPITLPVIQSPSMLCAAGNATGMASVAL